MNPNLSKLESILIPEQVHACNIEVGILQTFVLESSFAENDLGLPVDTKLNMN